jgi:hypothetical protein
MMKKYFNLDLAKRNDPVEPVSTPHPPPPPPNN